MVSFLIAVYISLKNTGSGDYDAYLRIYNGNIDYGELGYAVAMSLGRGLLLSFNQFQCIIATVSLWLILWVFQKYSKNYAVFFSLFFISEFFINLNTIRNYVARAFILLAFHYLIKEKRWHFLLSLLGATLFHVTSLFYLPLFFLSYKKERTFRFLYYAVAFVGIACGIIFLTGNNFSWLYNLLTAILPDKWGKIDAYFSTSTRFGFLIYFGLHVGNLYIFYVGHKQGFNKRYITAGQPLDVRGSMVLRTHGQEVLKTLYTFGLLLNLYTVCFFPLLMMSTAFCRVLNNIFFINVIYYAVLLETEPSDDIRYTCLWGQLLCITFMSTLPIVHNATQRSEILKSIKFFQW